MLTKGTLYLRSRGYAETGKIFYLSAATMMTYLAAQQEEGTDNPRVFFSSGHKGYFVPLGQEEMFKTPLAAKQAATNAGFDVVEDFSFDYWDGERSVQEERADALLVLTAKDGEIANGNLADGKSFTTGVAWAALVVLAIGVCLWGVSWAIKP